MDRLTVVVLVVTVVSLAVILELARRRHLKEKYALLWLAVGGMVALMSASRPLLDRASATLGIIYGPSMLFLFALLFLMAVAAHLSYEVSRLEERTRVLAEEIALLRADDATPPLVAEGAT